MQQIYQEGLYHPSVTQSITGNLFGPANFSTADVLQQNASMAAGFICTCGEFYDNPCRVEIRAVSTCLLEYLPAGVSYVFVKKFVTLLSTALLKDHIELYALRHPLNTCCFGAQPRCHCSTKVP